MSPVATFFVGIAPDHVPALVAALLLPLIVWLGRRLSPPARAEASASVVAPGPVSSGLRSVGSAATGATREGGAYRRWWPARAEASASITPRWAAALLGLSAAVHLALPLGHWPSGPGVPAGGPWDSPLLTVGFLGSGIAYAWVALRARAGRRWRLPAALLVVATLIGYLAVLVGGGEEADQVGLATALVELAVLGLALVPGREPGRPRRFARFAGSAATVTAVVVVGAVVWVGSFAAHEKADAAAAEAATVAGTPTLAAGDPSTLEKAGAAGHRHGHEHVSRSQAGVILRPLREHHPTAAQAQAAADLAAATKAATARFADLKAARAAGYKMPLGKGTGTGVHLEHDSYKKDGRSLDPQRPEQLVYAIDGGRATLLGVVFVMEAAGLPGPAPGGPITGWHAHNICISLLPPGLGVVSPFGGCPAFSFNLTSSEMMHVWVVDNPAGPFAEGLPDDWVRDHHATHGRRI